MKKWYYAEFNSCVEQYDNLHHPENLDAARYKYRNVPVVYALVNNVTGALYIGETREPQVRWFDHCITGNHSNQALQAGIRKHGLKSFTLYVLEFVPLDGVQQSQYRFTMRAAESTYMSQFSWDILYNYPPAHTYDTVSEESRVIWDTAKRQEMSTAMMGKNTGNIPANKGVKMTQSALTYHHERNAHRKFLVGLFDDMNNLVAQYASFNDLIRTEGGGRTTLSKVVAQGLTWKGWTVRYIK